MLPSNFQRKKIRHEWQHEQLLKMIEVLKQQKTLQDAVHSMLRSEVTHLTELRKRLEGIKDDRDAQRKLIELEQLAIENLASYLEERAKDTVHPTDLVLKTILAIMTGKRESEKPKCPFSKSARKDIIFSLAFPTSTSGSNGLFEEVSEKEVFTRFSDLVQKVKTLEKEREEMQRQQASDQVVLEEKIYALRGLLRLGKYTFPHPLR